MPGRLLVTKLVVMVVTIYQWYFWFLWWEMPL